MLKKRKAAFLVSLAESHQVIVAAQAIDVPRSTVYEWRASDVEFAAAWADVIEASTQVLEREAYRRACEGWVEREEFAVDGDGHQVLTLQVRKWSDNLLMFLLKARRPDVYRETHKLELGGVDGAPIAAEILTVSAKEAADASHDFLARLAGPSA